MTTNILSGQSLASPATVYTTELENVTYVDIQAIPSEGATGQVNYTVQRKTTNGAWRTATDPYGVPLKFSTVGDENGGITLDGLYARYLQVKVEILGGSGTLDIETEIIGVTAD